MDFETGPCTIEPRPYQSLVFFSLHHAMNAQGLTLDYSQLQVSLSFRFSFFFFPVPLLCSSYPTPRAGLCLRQHRRLPLKFAHAPLPTFTSQALSASHTVSSFILHATRHN